MFQMLTFDKPIPSCEIHELSFKDNKWYFTYALNTPVELTDDKEVDLIIYEYICDLILKDPKGLHEESINIHVKTLSEYLKWMEKQRDADLRFRERFLKEHPEAKDNLITKTLENRDYSYQELSKLGLSYFSFIVEIKENETIFAAV